MPGAVLGALGMAILYWAVEKSSWQHHYQFDYDRFKLYPTMVLEFSELKVLLTLVALALNLTQTAICTWNPKSVTLTATVTLTLIALALLLTHPQMLPSVNMNSDPQPKQQSCDPDLTKPQQ